MSGYAKVNGLEMYYEVHGRGRPLILLHGGFGSTAMFAEILPALAEGRRVIAADLRAHRGRRPSLERLLDGRRGAADRRPAPWPRAQARGRLLPLQAGGVAPGGPRRPGRGGTRGRRADEAVPDVRTNCEAEHPQSG
jgi:pimeloyl-ACP methyl ester carboxylesterase